MKDLRAVSYTHLASSTVLKDQETYNIIGTIPGTEEGMILLSAHYDSYFSGFQDDNAAVAMMLGIARAVLRLSLIHILRRLPACMRKQRITGICCGSLSWRIRRIPC